MIGSLRYRPPEADSEGRNALPLPTDLGDQLASLLAAPHMPGSAAAGDILPFNWVWQKLRESKTNAMTQLLWLRDGGQVAAASDALPLVHGYDFADWRIGEANRGHHQLIVPPHLPAGSYRLGIRPLLATGQVTPDIIPLDQSMTVSVPMREFEAPRFDHASGSEWANGIVLYGFSLARLAGRIDLGGQSDPRESLAIV